MRRACFLTASRTADAKSAGNPGHTRNTASTPSKHLSRVFGTDRSPRTTSTPPGKPAESGLRANARTAASVPSSWDTTCRPTWPVAPVTRITFCTIVLLGRSRFRSEPRNRVHHRLLCMRSVSPDRERFASRFLDGRDNRYGECSVREDSLHRPKGQSFTCTFILWTSRSRPCRSAVVLLPV